MTLPMALQQKFESNYFKGHTIDYELITFIIQVFMILPLIICAYSLIREIKSVKRYHNFKKIQWGLWIPLIILIITLCIITINSAINRYYDYIPTRWSDFDFFRTLLKTKKENLWFYLKMYKSEIDMTYLIAFLKSIVCFGGEMILYVVLRLQSHHYYNILKKSRKRRRFTLKKSKNMPEA